MAGTASAGSTLPAPTQLGTGPSMPCRTVGQKPYPYMPLTIGNGLMLYAKTAGPVADDLTAQFFLWDITAGGAPRELDTTAENEQLAELTTPALTNGHTYSWNVRTKDDHTGAVSPFGNGGKACYFRVDWTPPTDPTINTLDYAVNRYEEPRRAIGDAPGTFEVSARATDAPIVSFAYPGGTVAARDGHAVFTASDLNWGENSVTMIAYDAAGNTTGASVNFYVPAGSLSTGGPTISQPWWMNLDQTELDGNALVYDHGSAGGALAVRYSTVSGVPTRPKTVYSGDAMHGCALQDTTKTAYFSGDYTDIVYLCSRGKGDEALFEAFNEGGGQFTMPVQIWDDPRFGAGRVHLVAGDFDGTGQNEFALYVSYGHGHDALYVLAQVGTEAPHLVLRKDWESRTFGDGVTHVLAGDFSNTGNDDLALVYDFGHGHEAVFLMDSKQHDTFAAPHRVWNDQTFGADIRFATTGEFTTPGAEDLAFFGQYPNSAHAALFTLPLTGADTFGAPVRVWNDSTFGTGAAALTSGSFHGWGGASDLSVLYRYGGGSVATFTLPNSGGSFASRMTRTWADRYAGVGLVAYL
jgi:hypothetical protein